MEPKRARGMKDLLPQETSKYRYVIDIIRKTFESFGFEEVDTPALELWDVLTAKCGDEVKKQIFKLEGGELGLRFDLTIGLARLAASSPTLPKPFKRYCISKVWRHEEPQAGRFREFWQADADILGVASGEADAEVIASAVEVLRKLGLQKFKVRLNNRKILNALARLAGVPEEMHLQVFRTIDKLDKLGLESVKAELESRGLKEASDRLLSLVLLKGGVDEVLEKARKILFNDGVGMEGLSEVEDIYKLAEVYGYLNKLELDFSLARGLDYYTGPIFEVAVGGIEGKMGSIAGGGRYDELVQLIGGPPTPATGISIGLDRLVEVLSIEGKLLHLGPSTKVFIATVDDKVKIEAYKLASILRREDVSVELDLMGRKLDRQLKYADVRGIPYVIIMGEKELNQGLLRIRDMKERVEKVLSFEEALSTLKG